MSSEYFHVHLRQSVSIVIPLKITLEVITLARKEICPIPGVPPALLGVVNQRGRLLWVLELSDLLGLDPHKRKLQPQDDLTLCVLTAPQTRMPLSLQDASVGCVVSELKGIVSLTREQFKPVPEEFPPTIRSFISGVAEIEELSVALLNVNAVFTALSNDCNSLVSL